jgi:hypothetical protein
MTTNVVHLEVPVLHRRFGDTHQLQKQTPDSIRIRTCSFQHCCVNSALLKALGSPHTCFTVCVCAVTNAFNAHHSKERSEPSKRGPKGAKNKAGAAWQTHGAVVSVQGLCYSVARSLLVVRGNAPAPTRHTGGGNARFCCVRIPESAAAAGEKGGTAAADASKIVGTVRQVDGLEVRVWGKMEVASPPPIPIMVEELKCAPTSAVVLGPSAARCHVHL